MRPRPPLLRTVALLATVFVVSVALVLFLVPLERVVSAEGSFIGPSRAVRAPRDGRVSEVSVEVGERVEAGQVLLRLDVQALAPQRAEIAARVAGLEGSLAQIARERRFALDQTQPAARQALERAENSALLVLEAAQAKERRYGELRTQGLVEQAEYEDAVLARRLTEVDLEGVRAKRAERPELDAAELAGFDARASLLESERAALDARHAELELQSAQSEIVAPQAGFLLGPTRVELLGRAVEEGEELLRVALPGVEAFVAHVDDRGRARLATGQSARLRLSGYPWLVHGTVAARVIAVDDLPAERGYRVQLELVGEASPGPLFEGMRGRARIATAQRAPIAWLLLDEAFGLGGP